MVRLLAVFICQSGTNVVELKVDSHASIGTLKSIVLNRIPDRVSQQRIGARWFLEVNDGRPKDITQDADTRPLQDYGLMRHGNVLYRIALPGTDPIQRIKSIEACAASKLPLHKAAETNDAAAIKILIAKKKMQVEAADEFGCDALHIAACNDSVAAIEALISCGADPNMRDKDMIAPIHYAASEGHVAAVEALISRGANPDIGDNDGSTPLHRGAFQGDMNVINTLIASGANLNTANDDGRFPLHNATTFSHVDVLKLFVDGGARIDVRDWNGESPLHIAARRGDTDSLSFLIANGADIGISDEFSVTPLYEAAFCDMCEAAEMLLDNGADANATQKNGATPLGVVRGQNAACRALLKMAMLQLL